MDSAIVPPLIDLADINAPIASPAFVIAAPEGINLGSVVLNPSGTTAYAAGYETQSDLWRCAIPYMPEVAAVLLVLFGATIAAGWLWLRYRANAKARTEHPEGFCRRCFYPARGLQGTNCPECGLELRHGNRVTRPGGRWGRRALMVWSVLVLAAAGGLSRQDTPDSFHFQYNPGWYSGSVWRWAASRDIDWLRSFRNTRAALVEFDLTTQTSREVPLPPDDGLRLGIQHLAWHHGTDKLLLWYEKKDSMHRAAMPFGPAVGRVASRSLATFAPHDQRWTVHHERWRSHDPMSLLGYVWPSGELTSDTTQLLSFAPMENRLVAVTPTGPVKPSISYLSSPRPPPRLLYEPSTGLPDGGTYRAMGIWKLMPNDSSMVFQRHAFHEHWDPNTKFAAELVSIDLEEGQETVLGPLADDVPTSAGLAFSEDGQLTSIPQRDPTTPNRRPQWPDPSHLRHTVRVFAVDQPPRPLLDVRFECDRQRFEVRLAGNPSWPSILLGPTSLRPGGYANPEAPRTTGFGLTWLTGPDATPQRIDGETFHTAISADGRTVAITRDHRSQTLRVFTAGP